MEIYLKDYRNNNLLYKYLKTKKKLYANLYA